MANKLQDQFWMGRIPLRPLPYELKDKEYTHELMVDSTGENPTYHIFITSTEDPTKIIDLSDKLITEGFNSKELTIRIAGVQEPLSIQELLEYIYLRFVHIDDVGGFDPEKDTSKILDQNNKDVILKDINGQAIFPIVRATSIMDTNGVSLEDRLNQISHIAVTRDIVFATEQDQNTFDITYPFPNYFVGGNYMELRVGGTCISPDAYSITENFNEAGEAFGCTVTFTLDYFKQNRKIEVLFLYNSAHADGSATAIDGAVIANRSIPITKFRAVDSYTIDDPNSVATARALYKLYHNISDIATSASSNVLFVKDLSSDDPNSVSVNLVDEDVALSDRYLMLAVYISSGKYNNVTVNVSYIEDGTLVKKRFECEVSNGIGASRLLKLLVNKDECVILDITEVHIARNRYFHYCTSTDTTISFSGLEYDSNGVISVFRNGIRLFEDLDYSMNHSTQTITLTTRPAVKDVIVFECEYLSH